MTLAHGGTAGLFLELAFVAVPILGFVALAVVASRREKAKQSQPGAEEAPPDEVRG
jgi:hypothetical protein